jgi:hypothetical protein
MTMTNERDAVRRVLDYEDIRHALGLYVVAIDSRDFALFDSCFTPDASIDLAGMPPLNPESYRAFAEKGLAALDGTHHHLGLPLITLSGDRANARTYFIAQHIRNALAPAASLMIGGWYTDMLLRTERGWRIAARTGTAVWYEGNPMVLGYDFPMGATPRGEGHATPHWLAR